MEKYGTGANTITYSYDATGNRISKTTNTATTYYVRDGSGNVMAVYEGTSTQMKVIETDLYGSNRLGLVSTQTVAVTEQTVSGFGTVRTFTFTRGEKSYELSNHLGNVLSTISDRRQQIPNNSTVSYYVAEVTSATDYYPFGMQMPNRTLSSSSYRYGFNGQEKSSELTEGQYTAEFWEYDSRIGRRWNVDPKPEVGISEYTVFTDNPLLNSDELGDTGKIAPIVIRQDDLPNVYENHMRYIKKHPNEAFKIGPVTFLLFEYEPDKTKQNDNRTQNEKANPVYNTDPTKQEDEVAPAATKQGGARGVRMAVPIYENASHGGQVGSAIAKLKMGNQDYFLTILIASQQKQQPAPVIKPAFTPKPKPILPPALIPIAVPKPVFRPTPTPEPVPVIPSFFMIWGPLFNNIFSPPKPFPKEA